MTRPAGILSDTLIVAVPRADRSELQVRLCRHASGEKYVDLRRWEPTWTREKLKPGKGIALKLTELAAIAEALEKAAEK